MSLLFKRCTVAGLLFACLLLTVACSAAKSSEPKKTVPEQSAAYNYFLAAPKTSGYVLNPASEEKSGIKISFPEISGMKGELIQDYSNQTIYNEATSMESPDATEKNPLTVSYTVTRRDDHILSLIFTGKTKSDGKVVEMRSGVNIDLSSSNSINTTNIIKHDEASLKAFNDIFAKHAKAQNLETDKIDEFMSMNLDDKHLIFFFYDSENATAYSTVAIPLEEILPYLNTNFGEPPVS